ncbi:rRNA adenine N-6-methyltransferase family protein [Mycolicibacterium austroafricanum]|uniref:rRNA adenine N-6-methyltransferase family protein n=1 Tax=Mycolicibacterium austroafricanum TaxID=39687 RepID=UPI003AF3EB36
MIRDVILPWAMGDHRLGDDVLEVGPGYGATTDVLCTEVARLTAVEIDPDLAALLIDRFADQPSVQIECRRHRARLPRRPVHRRGVLHDAASRRAVATPGPAVRRDRTGASPRRGAGGQ